MFAFYEDKNQIKKCRLPNGYKLGKKGEKGKIRFSKDYKRYLWLPEKDDLFYSPFLKKIFKYLKWNRQPSDGNDITPSGYVISLDGYGKYKEIRKKETFWANNLQIRYCVPIIKI